MLSLASVKLPSHIQGQAFLGSQKAAPRDHIFAARDRMDETYDLIRAVRDKRYKYIRNYMPHLTYGQDIEYMNEMPTMQEMRRLNAEAKLQGPQKQYFSPTKPIEELYDTVSDPHEVKNLAQDPKYAEALERMREVHIKWMKDTHDIGLIPEPDFDELKRPAGKWRKTTEPVFPRVDGNTQSAAFVAIACATAGSSIAYRIEQGSAGTDVWQLYTKPVQLKSGQVLCAKACRIGFRDSSEVRFRLGDPVNPSPQPDATQHWSDEIYKTELLYRLFKIKELDYQGPQANHLYMDALKDEHASVRYWAVIGLHANCQTAQEKNQTGTVLETMLNDPAGVVRIASAHALCNWGYEKQAIAVLIEGLKSKSDKLRLHTITALSEIGPKARSALPQVSDCTNDPDEYVQRVARAILKSLKTG
jgi:hypothetical protein